MVDAAGLAIFSSSSASHAQENSLPTVVWASGKKG